MLLCFIIINVFLEQFCHSPCPFFSQTLCNTAFRNLIDGKMKKRRKAGSSMDGDVTPHASDKESEGEGLPKFDFPMFGNSPGPSPIPTPPSHPATPEIEEVPEVSSSELSFLVWHSLFKTSHWNTKHYKFKTRIENYIV